VSNFYEVYRLGQEGGNIGIPLGDGLENLTRAINGVQKGRIYTIASMPKVGKTTLTNYSFVISVYLHAIKNNLPVHWYYFSFEMSREILEFFFVTAFIYLEYKKDKIKLPEGVTHRGRNFIEITPELLMGKVLDDNMEIIKVPDFLREAAFNVYEKHVVKLFGRFDKNGKQIEKGMITLITKPENPTGIYKYLISEMEKKGTVITEKVGPFTRIAGYKPNNENLINIVVVDHIRKLHIERDMSKKQLIDKFLEYEVILRDVFKLTFVNVIHLNRTMTSIDRYKLLGDRLFPGAENIMDSSNLEQDSDYVLTLFNPNDDKFNLSNHFGLQIRDKKMNPIYPNLRTIHLVASRHTVFPQHFRTCMLGHVKVFEKFKQK